MDLDWLAVRSLVLGRLLVRSPHRGPRRRRIVSYRTSFVLMLTSSAALYQICLCRKDEGNDFYKKKDYRAAIEAYTQVRRGLLTDSTVPPTELTTRPD